MEAILNDRASEVLWDIIVLGDDRSILRQIRKSETLFCEITVLAMEAEILRHSMRFLLSVVMKSYKMLLTIKCC